MILKDLIYKGIETVSVLYPEREAREMVFAYMEEAFSTRRHTHILEPDYSLPDDSAATALSAFERMATGEPLQYITGKAYFYGRGFTVSPDVLIPRPETELLCREVLDTVRSRCSDMRDDRPFRVLDLCTGSGCIAWTLALEMPGAKVTAADISDGALTVAASQDFAQEISCIRALAPEFVKADILQSPDAGSGRFDVIVSNPPYVMDSEKPLMRANVIEHEPHLALFVPDDDPLKFYRAVASWADVMLDPEGFGIVEINESLGKETAEVFRARGFCSVDIIKDLSGKDRFVKFAR